MKHLLKSQINAGSVFTFWLVYGIIIYCSLYLAKSIHLRFIILIATPIILYISLALWFNCFYFYENKVKILYFFRFSNRIKYILYSDIKQVRYIHTEGPKQPMIVFVYKGETFSKLFKPSNAFTYRSYKKRKEILQLLANKNIPIEINSIFEKDYKILD